MPRISYFLGISIYMYFKDHNPPHFHAMYGDYGAMVAIDSGEVIAGKLPPRVASLVKEWTELHRGELEKNWQMAITEEVLQPIAPLE